ncbi:hypothetical protein A3709_19815 [Halioglobus sp. HI00S01]|nr:hypothetical protein A3709_19815 [Halioglobus sp. HI00S01]
MPDGSTASESEMLSARAQVTAFIEKSEKWLNCHSVKTLNFDTLIENRLIVIVNELGDEFNTELREYHSKQAEAAIGH